MSSSRRYKDDSTKPQRRREDAINDLLIHGSPSFRRYRRHTIIAFVALAITNAWALKKTGDTTDDNCVRIHRIVDVGSQVISGGKATLTRYLEDGTINQEQYDRALAQADAQLKLWYTADCP